MPNFIRAGWMLTMAVIAVAWPSAAAAHPAPWPSPPAGRGEASFGGSAPMWMGDGPHGPANVQERGAGPGPTPVPLAIYWEFSFSAPRRDWDDDLSYNGFGTSMAAGDVNGDGYPDLIIGASADDATGAPNGAVYLYFGGPLLGRASLLLASVDYSGWFGISVASAGDFNGDGFADVIVGSAVRAYVFFGSASPDTAVDLVLHGETVGDAFGRSVAPAGDVNGDGFDDVIVGGSVRDELGAYTGRAYVFFGGPTADAVPDLALSGEVTNDGFGTSVASAGDVNGDGFADVVVGASTNDAAGADAGRAYVYLGGATPDNTPDLVLTGEAAGDHFGSCVASVRDLNGDGFSDVVASAPENGARGRNAGRVYVYYGGPVPDAVPDLVLTGRGESYRLGSRVAPAGDVNGDGSQDLLVRDDCLYDDFGDAVQSVYVYLGGASVDTVADLVFRGWYQFGDGIAPAGDVEADGFDDILIGNGGPGGGRGEYDRSANLYGFNRFRVLYPNGGEVWNVGATQLLLWEGPARADVWLSRDDGATYDLLVHDVGGAPRDTLRLQVPRSPTQRARIKLTPVDSSLHGAGASNSPFVIRGTVVAENLAATLTPHGVDLSWSSDPAVGPTGIAGYRLYRSAGGESTAGTRVGPELIAEPRFTDPAGARGNFYRLVAVNGFGDEIELGRVGLDPGAPLLAWPLPYRGGPFYLSFALPGIKLNHWGRVDVDLYDIHGRLVRALAHANMTGMFQSIAWDGRDAEGEPVRDGVYFVRAAIAGVTHRVKLVVIR